MREIEMARWETRTGTVGRGGAEHEKRRGKYGLREACCLLRHAPRYHRMLYAGTESFNLLRGKGKASSPCVHAAVSDVTSKPEHSN